MCVRGPAGWLRRAALLMTAALTLLTATSAGAAAPHVTPLDHGLLSPLSVAVTGDGGVWYSENYTGLLHHRAPDGTITTAARAPRDLELSAVSELDGTVWYAVAGMGET